MQVLIVDDDDGIRNRLIDISTARGHEVVVAATPQQALSFLQRERFDLIFMRWHLAEESHLTHLRHVRSDRVPYHSYIVLLAAQEEADKINAGLSAGADNFLLTPFDPASLRVCFTLGERLVELERNLWEMHCEVERLALYDTTTGLPNHPAIEERARAELSRAQRSHHPLALILLDLSFQLLSDENIHTTG
ncbi:MAG: response regulator, partial [Ardenticatenales bacterium]|nr:response regulator [Ardenticatenales bacterium]